VYIKRQKAEVTLFEYPYITYTAIPYLPRTSPKMYRFLARHGKYENENMQNHALNLVNFGAHLSKILKYDIP